MKDKHLAWDLRQYVRELQTTFSYAVLKRICTVIATVHKWSHPSLSLSVLREPFWWVLNGFWCFSTCLSQDSSSALRKSHLYMSRTSGGSAQSIAKKPHFLLPSDSEGDYIYTAELWAHIPGESPFIMIAKCCTWFISLPSKVYWLRFSILLTLLWGLLTGTILYLDSSACAWLHGQACS